MPSKQKKYIKELTDVIEECQIPSNQEISDSHINNNSNNPDLDSKWPTIKMKVPDIFLHSAVNFIEHVNMLNSLGITFKRAYCRSYYIKIQCHTFNDQKGIIQYFQENKVPYHTYGHPSKRKMKVVIRGLPEDIDLNKIKSELQANKIPIIRVHKMHKRESRKNDKCLILAVVPYNEGEKLLKVEKILGNNVKMEPPKSKTRQCHRCQKWGHSQRYCYGDVKCVKCAGGHLSRKCERDANKEPPKCANCDGEHTANYRKCPCCPDSMEHKLSQIKKRNAIPYKYTDSEDIEDFLFYKDEPI